MARDFSDLNTRIEFHEMKTNEGFNPGEVIKQTVYQCWACVDTIRMKDYEQAKSNNTLEDLNIFIRNSFGNFTPTNKYSISILHPLYQGKIYNIKSVQPNLKDNRFIDIVVGRVS